MTHSNRSTRQDIRQGAKQAQRAYRDAQHEMRKAKEELSQLLHIMLDMPLRDALQCGIVKVNFATEAWQKNVLSRELNKKENG